MYDIIMLRNLLGRAQLTTKTPRFVFRVFLFIIFSLLITPQFVRAEGITDNDPQTLFILANGQEGTTLACINNQLKINGKTPLIGASSCQDITKIEINGDNTANHIDVSFLNQKDFSSLSSITINSGAGDDVITVSDLPEKINPGLGADYILGASTEDTITDPDGYRSMEIIKPIGVGLTAVADKPTPFQIAPTNNLSLLSSIEGINYDENASNNGGIAFVPANPMAATGLNHVVSVTNSSIEWHTKAGTQQNSQSLNAFFSFLAPESRPTNPQVIYDSFADRFLVVAAGHTSSPATISSIYVAVSDDSDPNGTWYLYKINSKVTITVTPTWADALGLAVDEEAVYITADQFAFSDNLYRGGRLWIMNKGITGGLYGNGPASATIYDPYSAVSTTPLHTYPAQVFGTNMPVGIGTWLVGYNGLSDGTNEFLTLIRVDNPIGSTTFALNYIDMGDLELSPGSVLPDAPQQGTSTLVETNDRRLLNAVWRNNSLWAVTQIVPGSGVDSGQVTAHWVKINTTIPASPTMADQGNIGGESLASGTYTLYPSVMVDPCGNAAFNFSASANTLYPGAYYAQRFAGDAAGTIQGIDTLAAGIDYYTRISGSNNRWGDYSGLSLDPSNQATFGVFNAYALTRDGSDNGRWGTRYGTFPSGLDFGDLPNSYNMTTFSQDGARHCLNGLRLGSSVDADGDGQPSATSAGDDSNGTADENGVTVVGNWSSGTGSVDVVTAGGQGCLSGWLDYWNGSTIGSDGDFSDSGEQIIANQPVNTGTTNFTFSLPVGAAVNKTWFSHFRLVPDTDADGDCTDQTAIAIKGFLVGGEVEDYQWVFAAVAPTDVSISGATNGVVNTNYNFTANVTTSMTSLPLTYNWSATGQSTVTHSNLNTLNDTVGFTWTTPGTKTITVQVQNSTGVVQTTHTIEIYIPPTAVAINGPTSGVINTAYTFQADVSPANTTTQLAYTWTATDLAPVNTTGGLSITQAFTWTTPGTKTITVSAQNGGGTVNNTYTIVISIPPSTVDVTGPSTGLTGKTYTFNAALLPANATMPVTYTWSATGQAPVVHVLSTIADSISFSWNSAGTKTVTITAQNAGGTVTDNQNIVISDPIAPTNLALTGPATGFVNTSYNFIADVSPANATLPITYTWTVDGQTTVTEAGGVSQTKSFTWSTTGAKVLTVVAQNYGGGSVSQTFTILIGLPTDTSPASLGLSGPSSGFTSTSYSFDATVDTPSTTQPIRYTWTATDQTPITVIGNLNNSQSFNWSTTGVKTITVTAQNAAGSVTAVHSIVIGTVGDTAPTGITLTGPHGGLTGSNNNFVANITPANTTQPVLYTWTATGQTTIVNNGGVSNGVTFNWATPGLKTVTVTAENATGLVTATQLIVIETTGTSVTPTSLNLTGPHTGFTNTTYNFSADVLPANTTTPLVYTWSATDQPTVDQSGGLNNPLSYTWTTPGLKTITVTATNGSGSVTKVHLIVIGTPSDNPPTGISITGNHGGLTGNNYTFTANITPANTTQPVLYTWSATDQATVTNSDDLNNSVNFTWATTGVKTIVVTAENATGVITATHLIVIETLANSVPPTGASLTGPNSGLVNTSYDFTAAVLPNSTSSPMVYTWSATDQPTVSQSGGLNNTFSYIWTTTGIKTVTVTATNGTGSVTASHLIVVGTVTDIAPTGLTMSGPHGGLVNNAYSFTASATPATTTTPILYTWTASDQTTTVRNSGLSDTFSYTWTTAGVKTITVTAENANGSVTTSHLIVIDTVAGQPPTAVTLDGPITGLVNNSYTFSAATSPANVSTPLIYTWTADGQQPVSFASSELTVTVPYTWSTPGVKLITVKVANGANFATASGFIVIGTNADIHPTGVNISGPQGGFINTTYSFNASVTPVNATQPIAYTWSATDLVTTESSGGLNNIQALSWSTPGLKIITVTATNATGSASTTHAIYIQDPNGGQMVPPNQITMSGPTSGFKNTDYLFTVNVSPIDTTLPVTYTWTATGHAPVVTTGDLDDSHIYQWPTTGAMTITVTAVNPYGSVSVEHVIVIGNPVDVPPTAVQLSGPEVGLTNFSYHFSANVSTANTTQPLAYSWSATDQPTTVVSGTLSNGIDYTWTTTGTKYITVTAANATGIVSATHLIFVNTVSAGTPISELTLTGPTTGDVNLGYSFNATVQPSNASQPITYIWSASEQGQTVQTDDLNASINYSWVTTGTKIITVTVTNQTGISLTQVHLIDIGGTTTGSDPLTAVDVTGPITGTTNGTYTFTASVSPTTAAAPIIYTWEATDKAPFVSSGGISQNHIYHWGVEGTKAITVTAYNLLGSVMGTHQITITYSPPITDPTGITLTQVVVTGPVEVYQNESYDFMAMVSPITTTTPVTYTWVVTDQATITNTDGGITNTVSYSWTVLGPRTIHVTAHNSTGTVETTFEVMVVQRKVYLPFVSKAALAPTIKK